MASGLLQPQRWTDKQFDSDRHLALARFIEERGRRGTQAYREAFARNEPVVRKLFEASDDLLRVDGELLQNEPELVTAARYLAGPPISQDDLETLTGESLGRRVDQRAAESVARVVQAVLDPIRFPWLVEKRHPKVDERETAIYWTAGLWAIEQLRTLWRTESSRRQETAVVEVLRETGFEQRPRLRAIASLDELPRGTFTREVVLAGSKCDANAG